MKLHRNYIFANTSRINIQLVLELSEDRESVKLQVTT